MFGIFRKDPVKKLKREYLRMMEEARDLQRGGDIQGFAKKTAEAEELAQRIEAMRDAG